MLSKRITVNLPRCGLAGKDTERERSIRTDQKPVQPADRMTHRTRCASEDLGDRELMEKRFDGLERKLDNLAVTGQSG